MERCCGWENAASGASCASPGPVRPIRSRGFGDRSVAVTENLFGRSRRELGELAAELGLPAYRGRQLFRHLYGRGVRGFEEMTDLSAALRERLAARFRIERPRVVAEEESADGTAKLAVQLPDGLEVETVAIRNRRDRTGSRTGRATGASARRPGGERPAGARESASEGPTDLTVCVSTQVGCPLACTFCRSGAVPFVRNLDAGEIAAQVMLAEARTLGGPGPGGRRNVVFMGMGEPLLNTDGVLASLELLTDPEGLAIPPRRITVSTVGLPEGITRLGREAPEVGLAVSLHAGDDETRGRFLPINRRYPMAAVFAALRELPPAPRRRLTIEYVLLGGENDRERDAAALIAELRRLEAAGRRLRVNLIPFNPWTDPAPGPPHRPGTDADAERFLRALAAAGLRATLRRSRGGEVLAACGQLVAGRRAARPPGTPPEIG